MNFVTSIAMGSINRPPTENQISSNPGVQVHLTTHNDEGKAVVQSTDPVKVLTHPRALELALLAANTVDLL